MKLNLKCFFGHCWHDVPDYSKTFVHGKFEFTNTYDSSECCRCGEQGLFNAIGEQIGKVEKKT